MHLIIGSAAALTAVASFFGGDQGALAAEGAETIPFAFPTTGTQAVTTLLGVAGVAVSLKAFSGANFGSTARASAVIQLALGGSVLALGARFLIESPSSQAGFAAVLAGVGTIWTVSALVSHWYHAG